MFYVQNQQQLHTRTQRRIKKPIKYIRGIIFAKPVYALWILAVIYFRRKSYIIDLLSKKLGAL